MYVPSLLITEVNLILLFLRCLSSDDTLVCEGEIFVQKSVHPLRLDRLISLQYLFFSLLYAARSVRAPVLTHLSHVDLTLLRVILSSLFHHGALSFLFKALLETKISVWDNLFALKMMELRRATLSLRSVDELQAKDRDLEYFVKRSDKFSLKEDSSVLASFLERCEHDEGR